MVLTLWLEKNLIILLTYILVFITNENEVLEKYGYFTGSLFSAGVLVTVTICFFASYYFFGKLVEDMERKDKIIKEKTENLEKQRQQLNQERTKKEITKHNEEQKAKEKEIKELKKIVEKQDQALKVYLLKCYYFWLL